MQLSKQFDKCIFYRKFNKAIEVLQGDMQSLERERDTLKHQLETQSRTPISPNMAGARRSKSFGSKNVFLAQNQGHVQYDITYKCALFKRG